MRLLERNNNGDFRLTQDLPTDKIPPYAILSHTWGNGEVLFRDITDGTCKSKAGYAKILFCGDQARRDGLKYFWVDTCCIDKSDSAELQHALNSMFQWYRNAAKCYVYLTDVSAHKRDADGNLKWELSFRESRWFTRGWTLQELIAPAVIEFFSKERKRLGDKKSLEQQIHDITSIPLGALQGGPLSDFSVEERMSWTGKRNTTRKEDKAYSLFGIFGIHIPLLYGEGEDGAFGRLREEISRHDRLLSHLHSTDPRLDKKRIEEAKGGLLADAYHWVFANLDFRRWHDQPESRLLWIKGDPGKGKTMLLCGIINELERAITADGHCRNLAYFFCQATDSRINNAIAVLRGLIYLLARQQPRLISHVRKYTDAGKSLSDANAWFALMDILRGMLGDPNLKPTYLVIDALDECIDDLPRLLEFIVGMSSTFPRVKWIVSSRNWPGIERDLNEATWKARLCLELNEASVSEAVTAYIRFKVHRLAGRNNYKPNTRDAVQSYLSQNAHGTFLWVALVCENLAKIPGWKAQKKLMAFPPGLNALYRRMMDQICNFEDSEDVELCKSILAVMSAVRRPITLNELEGFVDMPGEASANYEVLAEIIGLCGSFLTLGERTISFIHQSAKDFLLGDAAHGVFSSGIQDIHRKIFSQSLRIMSGSLQRDIYSLDAPGFSIDQVRVPDPDPLATVRYSCVYWVNHLYDWQSSEDSKHPDIFHDGGIVDDFLRQHYLHWLEALSLCKSMPQGILSMAKLESILQQRSIISQLPSLVSDMRRFILYWRWVVENYPLQVYASALVFSPARSITRGLFRQEERKWITSGPIVEDNWNACRQTLEGHRDSVFSVAFSPDSKWVASGSDDKTIKIWDAATGSCTQTLEGHRIYVNSVAFSPDSKWVASGSDDKTIKIWDAATGSCTQTLEGHRGYVNSVAFSPDSKWVASGSYDKTIKIWDAATGSCTQTLEGHYGYVNSVAFSPDSKWWVASGSRDNTIKIWDAATGSCTQTLEGHRNSVISVAFSPDSKWVASGSDDKTIKIWDAAIGSCTQTLEGHRSSVNSVAFSPDSKWVASGSYDKTIKIWDTATGSCTQTLEGHSDFVFSVAFSPNLKWVASGSYDNTIKIWDAAIGSCTQTLEGHSDSVISVAFSPDSKWVASGSYDKTIKIWDAATGSCTQTLEGHRDSVNSVASSLNSKLIASGSDDANPPYYQGYGIGSDNRWITRGSENWLWLPPEYQSNCSAVAALTVAISCSSGRVLTITFTTDS
ncbi:beta transducin-like protein HET-D2Y [Cladorrhinum sp. PSN259]|nr:beta transducin-like protein HET-D2Y [Cladorrhinum sp. PSN259]